MAIHDSERGHRLEQHPRRGETERERRQRGYEDRAFEEERELEYDDARYGRSSARRHWRGHDYDTEEEFERGRDSGDYDIERRRSLAAEHRDRFLRRDVSEERPDRYGGAGAVDWRVRGAHREVEAGPYAGRGPKGYKRSDERILEEVCERLTDHPSIDASDIEVAVNDGDVTLSGRVESRAVKHLTEAMVETVSGVKEVHNQLRVASVEGAWPRSAPEERHEIRPPEPIEPKPRRR